MSRVHISWGHWLSLAHLIARVDSLTQRVKEPLLTTVVDELPCLTIWAQAEEGDVCALHLWQQETRGRLCAVKLCSTNVSSLAYYTDELCLWFGATTCNLCFQLAFECFSLLINNNNNNKTKDLCQCLWHSAAILMPTSVRRSQWEGGVLGTSASLRRWLIYHNRWHITISQQVTIAAILTTVSINAMDD